MTKDTTGILTRLSTEILGAVKEIASRAQDALQGRHSIGPDVLASINTLTSGAAVKSLSDIDLARRSALEALTLEPSIARVTAIRTSDRAPLIYYITRGAPGLPAGDGWRLAGRNSPIGRLASLDVGEEFDVETPAGVVEIRVIERALLHTQRVQHNWDSLNSIIETGDLGPLTVVSMLDLLTAPTIDAGSSILERILAADQQAASIVDGIRRRVLTKIGLRDQPILDKFQDEIFRLPINRQLLIIGPPGSGKTTTLIRRLGQKLDSEYLDDRERKIVSQSVLVPAGQHASSWIMFTPTDLLKQYLKENFARENVPAPDQRVWTWSRYRLELARNHFRILRSANAGGRFVIKDDVSPPAIISDQTSWFEDFEHWVQAEVTQEYTSVLDTLDRRPELNSVSTRVRRALGVSTFSIAPFLLSLSQQSSDVQQFLTAEKQNTDTTISNALSSQLTKDAQFLAKLADALDEFSTEDDDDDTDDEDEIPNARTRVAAAAASYGRLLRSLARLKVSRRTPNPASRLGRLANWLDGRGLTDEQFFNLGADLELQSAIRRVADPIRRYLHSIPSRYRRFRRTRQGEGKWYPEGTTPLNEASALEVDLMLLSILKTSADLVRNATIRQNLDSGVFSTLAAYVSILQNQVLVDEATDFSPIQLACMRLISNPDTESFFASGDFHQRLTIWGAQSKSQFEWAVPGLALRPISIGYRQSKELNDFSIELIRLASGETIEMALPKGIDNTGFAPALGLNLGNDADVVEWLAARIREIEKQIEPLPSVAILVSDETRVEMLASKLRNALAGDNLNVVPCYDGQFAGVENDIRVFDVQHIKGLEFEAVFFIDVDVLAASQPDLFDKYIYVGATRAATYLGLTCSGAALPNKIASIAGMCQIDWTAD